MKRLQTAKPYQGGQIWHSCQHPVAKTLAIYFWVKSLSRAVTEIYHNWISFVSIFAQCGLFSIYHSLSWQLLFTQILQFQFCFLFFFSIPSSGCLIFLLSPNNLLKKVTHAMEENTLEKMNLKKVGISK